MKTVQIPSLQRVFQPRQERPRVLESSRYNDYYRAMSAPYKGLKMKIVLICGLVCLSLGTLLKDRMASETGQCPEGYTQQENDCVKNCDPATVGNGVCDIECNTEANNFDFGDCLVCEPGYEKAGNTCFPACPQDKIGNGVCDTECNIEPYGWDNGDCE